MPEHENILYDYHYFETGKELYNAYGIVYNHYKYRTKLLKMEQTLNMRLEAYLTNGGTLTNGKWTMISDPLDLLNMSEVELYEKYY